MMLDPGTIYRVVYSPTEFDYATVVGKSLSWHYSAKRARLAVPNGSILPISPQDFHARLDESRIPWDAGIPVESQDHPFRDDSMARR